MSTPERVERITLAGRAALVTGAGRRLGRAIAEALGARGMRVAVHYNGSEEGARDTARAIEAAGGSAHLIQADLLDPRAPAELVRAAAEALGGLDLVVNSAATMTRTPFGSITPEQWDQTMALNLRAPFFVAQAAAAVLAPGGSIVNIADLAAFESWPGYLPHGISKAGVVRMTRALAGILGPTVRVNAVAPGAVLLPDDWDEASAVRLASTTPLRRLGEPRDVTEAVLYLATAPYVTGQTLIVDGGRNVRH
ncbi:MAG: SDR family oxidoreductase [Gemmatimonadaceae bacterium]